MHSFNWIVSQIGARQHYGVPRGFMYQGHLRTLYTDFWWRWGAGMLKNTPRGVRALAGRFHPDIPSGQVVAYPVRSALARLRAPRARTTEAIYGEYLRFGQDFAQWVTNDLAREHFNPDQDAFFGFNTGCLETLRLMRERGVLTIVDQIDPARREEELVFEEVQKWPGWQDAPGRIPAAYFDRLAAEWEAADLVLVNSEWSKDALIAQGVPEKKLLTVPVAYEPSEATLAASSSKPMHNGPLTVLWLGTVNLRKGIPYLLGAARLLERTNIRFIVAGPLEISRDAVASAPPNVSFPGRITRDETTDVYRQADVFVLPTISDGFAITQVEAMARGLPVITTRNCGQVVTPGIDGLLIPTGDERALAEAIAKLDSDRDLLHEMSRQAVVKARTFHLPRQAAQIENAMSTFRQGFKPDSPPPPQEARA